MDAKSFYWERARCRYPTNSRNCCAFNYTELNGVDYNESMIEETFDKIKTKIRTTPSITGEKKNELLTLLSALESEIAALAKAQSEHAESIAGFVERSTHEATRRDKDSELLRLSLAGLTASVKSFEVSHPQLVRDINYISTMLANMGI
jgi:hypothetical protein